MVAPVQVGDVLADKYVVDRVLGEGGMGVVVAATHKELGQKVALKFMHSHLADNAEAAERFLREARACVQLRSEHIARVTDVGRLGNSVPYIVMEYLEGQDLNEVAQARGAIPAAEAVDYVLQACEAMAEAHALGIIHRDLKPENLFLTQRPNGSPLVKVLDFGISKMSSEGGLNVTKTSTAMGSPAYMAPEQMRSAKHVDHRADIWSLGVVLYQLMSGHLPYNAETAPELFAKVLTEEPMPFRAVNVTAPDGLVAVVEQCLSKDVDARIPTIRELQAALAPFGPGGSLAVMAASSQRGEPSQGFMPTLAVSPAVATTTHTLAAGEAIAAPVQRGSRGPIVAAGVVVCAGLALLVVGLTRGGGADEYKDDSRGDSAARSAASPAQPPPASAAQAPDSPGSAGSKAAAEGLDADKVTPTAAATQDAGVVLDASPVPPQAKVSPRKSRKSRKSSKPRKSRRSERKPDENDDEALFESMR